MQSLHLRGVSSPEDVVQHSLVAFRRPHIGELIQFIPENSLVDNCRIEVACSSYTESGPLANLPSILCVAARRILPGHLLRRSKVLSSFQQDNFSFQQRIAITACSGEESILNWSLKMGINMEGLERWVIHKISHEIDCSRNALHELPVTPHPKHSPEVIISAQLNAFRKKDIFEASSFNACIPTKNDNRGSASMKRMPVRCGIQYNLLQKSLSEDSFLRKVLMGHIEYIFGPAALPTQHSMIQEVLLRVPEGSFGDQSFWGRLTWALELQKNGCWMITNIEYPENEAHAII